MIIKLYSNRKVEPSSIIMANQHENMTRVLEFNLEQVPNGYRYLVLTNSSGSNLYLITDNKVDITSAFTWNGQTYEANVVVSNIELENELVSTNVLWISNTFRLQVRRNNINAEELSKLPIPPDLQMPYDKLLQLIEDVEGKLENGEFNGKDGVGIKSIEKTRSEGLVDTYTITLTDDSTFVYTVTNGKDGIDGKSAYELAVENGFKGTEEEWLESLQYDHSDEFKQLAEQVKQDAKSAADSATKAESAMNEANTTAQENVEAIKQVSANAQNAITITKDNAVQSVQSAQQTAENAIGTKQTEAVQAVDTAKTSATQAIAEQKESAVSAITQERSEAIEAIETGKTNALETITTAKDNAIEEIENTGVPLEDIEKLAIKETAEGNPTIINDSADWRLQKLNVYGQSEQDSTTGKNLLNPTGATKVGWNIELPNFRLEVGKQYTYTAPILEGSKACGLFAKASDTELVSYLQSGKTKTFTVSEKADFSQGILLAGGNEDALTLGDELTAMVELGSVATEFEPYTGGKPSPSPDYPQEIISKEISEIKFTGKNLFNVEWIKGLNTYKNQSKNVARLPKGKYTLKVHGLTEADLKSGSYFAIRIKVGDTYTNTYWIMHPGTPNTKCLTGLKFDIVNDFEINLYIYNNTEEQLQSAYDTLNGHIQINNGYEESQYEPYKEQIVNLTSPITLRGIPADNGENVTIDEQQYIADVIKEKDGVIGVERNTAELVIDGSDIKFSSTNENKFWNLPQQSSIGIRLAGTSFYKLNNYFNNRIFGANKVFNFIFIYTERATEYFTDINDLNDFISMKNTEGSPLKIVYPIEPTFEPLPEEIQTQYKELKSYYPNTVIQTGCFNEVEYVADTKTWIENKINGVTELALGIGGK